MKVLTVIFADKSMVSNVSKLSLRCSSRFASLAGADLNSSPLEIKATTFLDHKMLQTVQPSEGLRAIFSVLK